jgi:hypothetical protein
VDHRVVLLARASPTLRAVFCRARRNKGRNNCSPPRGRQARTGRKGHQVFMARGEKKGCGTRDAERSQRACPKRGVHVVFRRRPMLEPPALFFTPAYQKGQIARLWTDFPQLLTSNPWEEPVQKFIEKPRSFGHSSSHSASTISPPSSQGKTRLWHSDGVERAYFGRDQKATDQTGHES